MLSSKAGGYMNGGYITVDGGRAMVNYLLVLVDALEREKILATFSRSSNF